MPQHGIRVDVPDAERHLDTAANRCLLAMLQALLMRCRDIRNSLNEMIDKKEEDSDTRTGLTCRWPTWKAILDRLEHRLSLFTRRTPFDEVTRAEVTAAGLNAVSAHPLYARAYRSAWLALRRGIAGDRDEPLPLSPTWEIYERWCYHWLLRHLKSWLPGFEWTERTEKTSYAVRCWEAKNTGGTVLKLMLQPTFRCTNGNMRDGFWSVSRRREPDIVLWRCQRGLEDFVIMDAKYRASRSSLLESMGTAHTYQDSLRLGGARPSWSILLVPTAREATWLEEQSFLERHKVGIASLKPDVEPPMWLRDVLVCPRPYESERTEYGEAETA